MESPKSDGYKSVMQVIVFDFGEEKARNSGGRSFQSRGAVIDLVRLEENLG